MMRPQSLGATRVEGISAWKLNGTSSPELLNKWGVPIQFLDYAPHNPWLVGGSGNWMTRCGIPTAGEIADFKTHYRPVTQVTVSANGQFLLVPSADNSARF